MKILVATAAFAIALSANAQSQTIQPDPDVRAALTGLGIQYEVLSGGDYKITIPTEAASTIVGTPGRSQTVGVGSKRIESAFGQERFVYTLAAVLDSAPSRSVSNALLTENGVVGQGLWFTFAAPRVGYLVEFGVRVPSNTSPSVLKTIIGFVAVEGDKMEKQLFGTDTH